MILYMFFVFQSSLSEVLQLLPLFKCFGGRINNFVRLLLLLFFIQKNRSRETCLKLFSPFIQ
jgi:hypothetical protein